MATIGAVATPLAGKYGVTLTVGGLFTARPRLTRLQDRAWPRAVSPGEDASGIHVRA